MDMNEVNSIGGSLQISKDVIAKMAKIAALEIDGVKDIANKGDSLFNAFKKVAAKNAIDVVLLDEVAQITINIIIEYGKKAQPLAQKVQENIKSAVQNMTGITVSRVNIIIAGVARDEQEQSGNE